MKGSARAAQQGHGDEYAKPHMLALALAPFIAAGDIGFAQLVEERHDRNRVRHR